MTLANPALPGELISIYAAGLGLLVDPVTGNPATNVVAGQKFTGGRYTPAQFVSALAGGATANIINANLSADMIGVYQIDLQLGTGIPTNPLTQITISQGSFVSNVATLPVLLHPLVIASPSVLPAGVQNHGLQLQVFGHRRRDAIFLGHHRGLGAWRPVCHCRRCHDRHSNGYWFDVHRDGHRRRGY